VLWIGGPPASGKTTIATRLARRHGLRLYSADTRTWIHRDRALAAGHPHARRFEALAPDERWVRPVDELLAMSLHRERAAMVLDDVRSLPRAPLVVAEGSTVPAGSARGGVWLLPTAGFQAAQLDVRGVTSGARRLYEELRRVIEQEARDHGLATLTLDERSTVDGVLARVEDHFTDTLRANARATDRGARRVLLREANLALVEQVRGYHSRPWADGSAAAVTCTFVCECGRRDCTAEVATTVARAAAGPVLGTGHR
jgi:hypothetical protein